MRTRQDYFPGHLPLTLVELLRLRAEEQADRGAYTFLENGESEGEHTTYGEMDLRARSIGARLAETGAAGERALLLFPPGLEYVRALFGCFYGGVIAVPVYPPRRNKPTPRLQSIIDDCRPTLVLTTAELAAEAGRLASFMPQLAEMRWVATDGVDTPADAWCPPVLRGESIAFLQYTSGSTSSPKGVAVSHGNLLHNFGVIERLTGYTPDERSVIWLPPYHDMGLIGGILQPMYTGYWAALMPPAAFVQRPARWLEAITRYRATTSGGPNFAYELCVGAVTPADRERLDLSSWRVAFNGAEPVRSETLDAFTRTFAPQGFRRETFYPCYGLAEGTLMVTGSRTPEPPRVWEVDAEALGRHRVRPAAEGAPTVRLVGCGHSVPEQTVRIVDPESFRACGPGEVGEIWVRGPSVASGYWERPDDTERAFGGRIAETGEGPFLRTGDLGVLDGGELYVTGRIKELVIIRGRNHYPHDLEQTAAGAHPALRRGGSAAFAVDEQGEERLVVVQEVGRHATRQDAEELASAIRAAVAAEHELQVHTVVLVGPGGVPKTSSGKTQRLLCRADFVAGTLPALGVSTLSGAAAPAAGAPPPSPAELAELAPGARVERVEEWVRTLVAGALRVPADQVDGRPLAALGVDSMRAVSLAAAVEGALGVRLPPTLLLDGAGAAEVAAAAVAGMSRTAGPLEPGAVAGGLSPEQERMWFLHALAPESAAYNLPMAVRITGALDEEALRRAVDETVRRHETLRTVFPLADGRPQARVRPPAAVPLPRDDLAPLSAAERAAEAARRAREEAAAPFDLAEGALLRARLLRLGAEEHLLVLVTHHIVSDGLSAGVLLREVPALYAAAARGLPSPLAEPASRYEAWSARRRAWLASAEAAEQLEWWSGRLRGAPQLELPTDRPRPPVQGFAGGTHPFRIPAAVADELRALARSEGATLYMALLAAWQLLLARWSGQEDVSVGAPVSVRDAGTADAVGLFVNTLVLRTEVRAGRSFRDLVRQVRGEALSAYARRDLPFDRVVESLHPGRDLSHNPLFQVMLAFQGAPLEAVPVPGALFAPEPLNASASILDLTLYLWERPDGALTGSLEFAAELFDGATAAVMAENLVRLMHAAAAEPDLAVERLDMTGEEERARVLGTWSRGSAAESAVPVHELFAAQAARTPHATALRHAGAAVTYAALEAQANRIAHLLRARGVGAESRVGVCLERTPLLPAALLGVLKAGAAYVPLDPAYPADRLAYVLGDAGAALVLAEPHLAGRVAGPAPVVALHAAMLAPLPAHAPEGGVGPRSLAYVLYTSGSTGLPKGVAVEHGSAAAVVAFLRGVVGPEDRAAVLGSTSASFDVSVGELFGTLCWGGTVVLVEQALELPRVAEHGVRVVVTVPSAAAELLRAGGIPASVRQLNLAGEPLPADLVRGLYALGHVERVLNLYGPTEDTVYSTWCRVEPGSARVPIGRPVAGGRAYVLERGGAPAGVGVPGELCLGGAGVARGYLGRPALTAERFVPDPFAGEPGARMYRTGDRARWTAAGHLEYLGRLDQQVKVRGFRIEPGEVEAALRALPGVCDAVVGVRDEATLVAWVVPADATAPPAPGSLRARLRERLPDFMVPAAYVRVERLPRTGSGKLDRNALPAPAAAGAPPEGPRAPRTDTQALLAPLWAEVLGVGHVGPDDDFFELGGHSLLGVRLVERVRDVLGAELPLRALFDAPSLAGFASRAEAALRSGVAAARSVVAPAPRAGALPLSFAQERLWFLERLRPGAAAYVMPAALRLRGALDEGALRASLDALVARHEALRTVYRDDRGRPVQVVEPPRPMEWVRIDASATPPEARDAELLRLAREEAARPFDLERGPVVRAALVHAGTDDHLLLLSIHHIACDGWSLGVLAREISALYAAALDGSGDALEAPPLGYPDFAVWQRAHVSGDVGDALFTWWRTRLGAVREPAEIPTDRPRPPVQSFRGAQLSTSFGAAVSMRVHALARGQRATPFMVLLAAWKAVMRRRLESDRVVVGTDVAGRGMPELAGVVGLFVNQVVLATDTSGDPSFLELLARVRANALEAYAHADLPFNRLVDALNPVRDPARNPLFQVMVVLDNTPAPELRFPGVVAEVMELQLAGAPFDLSLLLSEDEGGVHCVWRYNPDLFEPSTVERLAAELADALERATADPEIRLGALHAALGEAEQARRGAALERLRRASADRFRRATAPRRPSAPGAGAGPAS